MDRTMAPKHLKAKKEAIKAALEMANIKGSAGVYNSKTSVWFFKTTPYACKPRS